MTVDDESSIYVGGLPYDATEESLRRVFDIYGAVVAVKIINDRTVGGKCYGFVTFANPRSAMHAIDDMDGRMIDGRPVRVNEVKTRGGRPSFSRERNQRKFDRGMESSDRGHGREKDYDHYHNYRERSHDRDQERQREYDRMHDQEREREYDRMRDDNRSRDRFVDRERVREHNKDLENIARERERSRDYDWERDLDADREIQRSSPNPKSGRRTKAQMPELPERSHSADRGKRSRSSELNDDSNVEVANQLEISNKKFHELQEEISRMEELADEKKDNVLKLQDRVQNLEDALSAAKKVTSLRKMQLSKYLKCYQQVRDYSETLKNCEQELQFLVESTLMEMDNPEGMGGRDGILANGA